MNDKIVILQRVLPHYRIGFFKQFCLKFPGAKIFFGQPHKNESLSNAENIEENFFLKFRNLYFDKSGQIFISKIYSALKKTKPSIIISVFNVGNLNIYILFLLRKFFGFKIILWSFGYNPSTGFNPKERFADKLRLYFSQRADAVIFYWEQGLNEVAKDSKKTGHYFIAPNTLDTQRQFELKKSFDKTGKAKIKDELGIKEGFNFVYVGRLIEDKQVDILLKAFAEVEKKCEGCRLNIIGDGPEKEKLLRLVEDLKLKNVYFAGEITDESITGKWIYISDAFVMPGRLGLSVVHSFCFGTPVISQKKEKYFHGEGVGYIKDGSNGFLIEDGNIKALSDKMYEIITNSALREKLSKSAFETASTECSIENMLEGFEKAIGYVRKN